MHHKNIPKREGDGYGGEGRIQIQIQIVAETCTRCRPFLSL